MFAQRSLGKYCVVLLRQLLSSAVNTLDSKLEGSIALVKPNFGIFMLFVYLSSFFLELLLLGTLHNMMNDPEKSAGKSASTHIIGIQCDVRCGSLAH